MRWNSIEIKTIISGHHGYYPGHTHAAHAHSQIHNNRMDWPPAESQFYPSELRYTQPHQVQIHHPHHSPDFPPNIRGRGGTGVERSKEGRENER